MSNIIEVYISQSDIPNWALNPGVDSSIQMDFSCTIVLL